MKRGEKLPWAKKSEVIGVSEDYIVVCEPHRISLWRADQSFVRTLFKFSKRFSLLRSSDLLTRLLRLGYVTSEWVGSTLIVALRGGFFLINLESFQVRQVPYPKGSGRPLSLKEDILWNAECRDDQEKAVIFGAYNSNHNKKPVDIYRLHLSGRIEIVAATIEGQSNHIHFVRSEEAAHRYLLASGDFGEAARIYKMFLPSGRIEPLSAASQRFRMCWCVGVDGGYIFATDRQDAQNELIKCDADFKSLSVLSRINGSSIDGRLLEIDGRRCVLFSTAVEGVNSEGRGFSVARVLATKIPPAFVTSDIVLYKFDLASYELEILATFPKDRLPFYLFQFGRIKIPSYNEARASTIFVNVCGASNAEFGVYKLCSKREHSTFPRSVAKSLPGS